MLGVYVLITFYHSERSLLHSRFTEECYLQFVFCIVFNCDFSETSQGTSSTWTSSQPATIGKETIHVEICYENAVVTQHLNNNCNSINFYEVATLPYQVHYKQLKALDLWSSYVHEYFSLQPECAEFN